MKIAWIRIRGFQQFEDTFLDFRNPETGRALDKVCLIGRNGTGKSTILQLLLNSFCDIDIGPNMFRRSEINLGRGLTTVKIEADNFSYILVLTGLMNILEGYRHVFLYLAEIESIDHWFDKLFESVQSGTNIPYFTSSSHVKVESPFHKYEVNFDSQIKFKDNNGDLLIYCPAEERYNGLTDGPYGTLQSAIALFKNFPFQMQVSNETTDFFWEMLIYLIRKREIDRSIFEDLPANQNKTKRQLKEEFDSRNPEILKVVSDIWNEILAKAGLRFDYEHAKMPIQLDENLQAYIISKHGDRVDYHKLSTGIRNYIFRFGHFKSVYFDREIKRGLLLVDEPENSLFPDFLLDIISRYEEVTTDKNGERNTQMFFATHSPIIAAQFKAEERIILEWDDNGSVKARKGEAPEGDDPNDILYQDFGMTEIVSKKGQEVWKAYLDLKKKLSRETDDGKKKKIAEEILEIGREYKFVR